MQGFGSQLKLKLTVLLLSGFIRCLSWTWRVAHINRPDSSQAPVVYAHWHQDELLLVGAYVGSRMTIMASRSRDGELMKQVLQKLGYSVVRGSSSRGGAGGLKGLIDAVRNEGLNASLAVDGPRGPIFELKPGILKLAQQSGAALVPGGCASNRKFVFKKAWNQCYLPLPFSKSVIVYGKPRVIPRDCSPTEFETIRKSIELELRTLKVEAESRFGTSAPHPKLEKLPIGV